MSFRIFVIILSLVFLAPNSGIAQKRLFGKVIDVDGKPLSFASVVYLNWKKGTSADAKGHFEIEYKFNDTLLVTMVGFLDKKIPVNSGIDSLTCILGTDYSLLKTIEIRSVKSNGRRSNFINVGHYKKPFTFFSLLASDLQEATYIPNDREIKGTVKEIKFGLKNFRNSNFALRVRILDVDTLTGLPGTDLLLQDNLIFPDKFKKNMKISLESNDIPFSPYGVFVSLEFLPIDRSQGSKTPWVMGNQKFELNHSYNNYKNLGWIPNLSRSPTSGKFLTQSIGLSIKIID